MAQHDYDVANGSGAAVRADINALAAAIVSHNSGTGAPSTTFPYMFWMDTTAALWKMRNSANSAWITIGTTAGAITLADMAQGTIKGRANAAGTGTPTDLTALQVKNIVREVGEVISYAGTSAPTGWLFCYGQNVSRTTYALLFAAISTTFGVGDGSTTFGVPDLRGRVVAGKDDMGGSSANRLTSPINGDNLGAAGGAESVTLTTSEMPSHSHGVSDPGHNHLNNVNGWQLTSVIAAGAGGGGFAGGGTAYTATGYTGISIQNNGSGGAHANVQPTIILNKIIFAGV